MKMSFRYKFQATKLPITVGFTVAGLASFLLFFNFLITPSPCPPRPEVTFLNDRASSVIGAMPLTASGFIRPEGLTGTGQVVAIADSGLGNGQMENPHPDLKSLPGQMPKVIMLKSWADREKADDPDGHGTHLAATIAGTGAASNGKFAGVAPGASIYFQAILNPENKPAPPADLATLFGPAYKAAARIHVDGWGSMGNAYTSSTAQVDAFTREYADFLVIFGTGNNGPQAGNLTNEANSKNALVVGASEGARPAFGLGEDNINEVAYFSSRGPTTDGRLKPDLVAPGSGIISAASPLTKSNFPAHPLYTRMQGTSQAAAVTAGAAALLREYFQKEEGFRSPSAALLKAALINGARPIPDEGAGFGRLDLTTTTLALKEKLFFFVDEKNPLRQDEARSYRTEVYWRTEPFTATLAWTDPPAAPGAAKALVNDLDLVVTAPNGKKYLGNDDTRQGIRDERNNVERVVIPYPLPGIYTIEIKAAKLTQGLKKGSPAGAQDFALVFGQPPVREIISSVDNKVIKFASGNKMTIPPAGKNVLGRYLVPWESGYIFPGEDTYIAHGQNPYLVGGMWRTVTSQNLPLTNGTLFLEANPEKREGGFYFHPRVTILANEQKINKAVSLPAGIPAIGLINPSSQTLWWIKTDYQTKDGVLKEIDGEKQRIFLLHDQQPYSLSAGVSFSFIDTYMDGSRADLPFGMPVPGTIDQLKPGMPVQLIISPTDNQVVYVAAKRSLAVGEIKSINVSEKQITLKEGTNYQVITGTPVIKDGKTARFDELKAGLHATLLLADNLVIGIQEDTAITYGQIVYFESVKNKLYFLDYRNRLQTLTLSPEAALFRWWQPGEISSLLPGEWVRLTLDDQSKMVVRIDVAYAQEEQSSIIDFYDSRRKLVAFGGGSRGLVSACTNLTKNGYPVQIEDFVPREKVEFILLRIPKSEEKILAIIKGQTNPGVKAPLLRLSCWTQEEKVFFSGVTGGEHIYIYTEDGQAVRVQPRDGQFSVALPRPEGKTLQVVAVERRTGGVTGMYVTIPEPVVFRDTAGHPAQKEIEALAAQGLLKGYPDGTFKPNQQVTRAEFTVMLARTLKLKDETTALTFSDQLPAWAASEISLAAQYGIISGYPDGTFNAHQSITGLEAICILARAAGKIQELSRKESTHLKNASGDKGSAIDTLSPPDPKWSDLPFWSAGAAGYLSRSGLFSGYSAGRLYTFAGFTRAEAALIIYHIYKTLSN